MSQQLQIEAGKYYRARNGAKVGPMKWLGVPGESWSGFDPSAQFHRTYFSDGKWMQSEYLYSQDLIATWDEPEQPEAESVGREAEENEIVDEVKIGDRLRLGDIYFQDGETKEIDSKDIGCGVYVNGFYRRRVPTPAPPEPQAEQVPSVDLREHELSELRKANADLLDLSRTLERNLGEANRIFHAERDKLAERCRELEQKPVPWLTEIEAERDKLREELQAAYGEAISYIDETDRPTLIEAIRGQNQKIKELQSQLAASKGETESAKADCRKLINSNQLSIANYNELVDRYF